MRRFKKNENIYKVIVKYSMMFITIIILFFDSSTQAQNSLEDQKIMKALRDFYSSYISENSKPQINASKIEAIKKKYCTIDLINKIDKEELDYDPLLNAQDCDIQWLKTLSVNKDNKRVNVYFVSYIDNYSKKKNTITLKVIKEKESYKIASIL